MKRTDAGILTGRSLGLIGGVVLAGFLLSYGVTQEVPIGQLQGRVVMQENGKPLVEALVTFTPMSDIDNEVIRPRYAYTNGDGAFSLRNMPAGAYEMEVSAEHHRADMSYVWIEEGKSVDLNNVALKPDDPYLQLYASQRVFTPGEKPNLEMHGFTPTDDVKLEIYKLDLENLAKNGGLQEALYPLSRAPKLERSQGTLVSSDLKPVTKRDAEGAFIERLKLPELNEGFFLVKASAGKKLSSATYLNITRIAMVTKTAGGRSLGYVMDIGSGQPIAGAEVLHRKGNALVPAGQTQADGTFRLPVSRTEQLALVARKGSSTALVGFSGGNAQSDVRIVTITDRPVYRPGDEMSFKTIVRRWAGDHYEVPHSGTASVTLLDPQGQSIESKNFLISRHGTINGSFESAEESEPGYWMLRVDALGGSDTHGLPIQSYRKPEYTVEVSSMRPYFIAGQEASAKVHCEYYFGGPVIGAKVKASIYRSPYYAYSDPDEEEDTSDYDSHFSGGEYYEEIEAVTDANGDALIEFNTKASGDPEEYPTDFTYTVAASVADEGDKYFDGDGEVKVVRGGIDLNVDVDRYVVEPGGSIKLAIRTSTHDDKPAPNRKVTLVVGREEWTSRTSFLVPDQNYEVTTDSQGKATLDVKAGKPGSMQIKAVVDDDRGNKITSDAYVYVPGEGADSWEPDSGDFKLVLDKKVYAPGETAKVLIQTKKTGGKALLTIEADEVMWHRVVALDKQSTLIELPVKANYAPDAFVNVEYVKDKTYMSANRRFREHRSDRELKVEVTPSQPDYKPGEMAELTVETRDEHGKPVSADVSLSVVDESIYAIRSDSTNIVRDLYPNRYDSVQTAYSFPSVYLDGGDKGALQVALRTKFKDTALWRPNLETDSSGRAKVQFQLPDNLTQWRATAVAVTDESIAGMARAQFRARKELMVRLQPPMFLTQFDSQRMVVIVTNDTGKDQDVNVKVDAEGLALEGKGTQRVRVRSGNPETLVFTLNAEHSGTATLTARAWVNGGPSDGVQQKLKIEPHARDEVELKAGEAKPRAVETITLGPGVETGSLKVTLAGSLTSGLVQSLPGLVDYPYGCVEQTMSRFLPAVVVAKAMGDLKLEMPELDHKLPRVVDESYARLAKMQHGDGDWGWWEYDDPNAFMTALVLDGIDHARLAGYPAKYVDLKKGLEAAVKLSKKAPVDQWKRESWDRDRIYLAYVLARFGKKQEAIAAIKRLPAKLGASEMALLTLTYQQLGNGDEANASLDRLMALASSGALMASWAEQSYAWGAEPTALALNALMAVRPNDPAVPKIVRFLRLNRRGDMWTSTRDTSYALIALTDYMAAHPEGGSTGDATVSINGAQAQTLHIDAGSTQPNVVDVPLKELKSGSNKVEITTTGKTCYYAIRLDQYAPERSLIAQPGKGLNVVRQYFVMQPRMAQDGVMRLLPSEQPVWQVNSGDILRVVLDINSDVDRQYVMVEDPVPSNCRVTERTEVSYDSEWGWWWSRTVLRDDRITFFATHLPKGKSQITYTMRAESPGTCGAPPTHLENMYDPSQAASGASQLLEIRP